MVNLLVKWYYNIHFYAKYLSVFQISSFGEFSGKQSKFTKSVLCFTHHSFHFYKFLVCVHVHVCACIFLCGDICVYVCICLYSVALCCMHMCDTHACGL